MATQEVDESRANLGDATRRLADHQRQLMLREQLMAQREAASGASGSGPHSASQLIAQANGATREQLESARNELAALEAKYRQDVRAVPSHVRSRVCNGGGMTRLFAVCSMADGEVA